MKSLRVIVADDEILTRMDLKEMLAEQGHKVVGEANNGATALELVQKLRPDLAILDIKMDKMDGIKVAKLVTGQKICGVLLLTAYNEDELVKRALDAGVMAYLTKPVTERELEPAIRVAWARFQDIISLKSKKAELKETLNRDIRQAKLKNTNGAGFKK
ncbi:ANTAR domain-containing response regulator [Desulfoscipio geothermicus]|uniref:Stage 0 sporulation protein A homolog n=1 Tax=Desulfoscipio geothermicus DSM 3669 TaxID=1121426 RepID=A0A1I6CNT8_9FIRM|nr:response regulator [Desulfoscipio geothermicus]SFQ94832.1 response regulator receiver and ANTAR domain protein [Desulfoscipio geothermicus DSM 3669]